MSIDYGRLTAKDRREVRAAAHSLCAYVVGDTNQWSWWAWLWEYPASTKPQAGALLESLLMTDEMFR